MHRVVPELIIENYRAGRFNGEFPAVGMFLDLSGFSTMTDTLMQHGQHGAEVLAGLMHGLFDPIVSDLTKLLSNEDAGKLGNALENNSSAVLMLFENTWATRLADALHNAQGELVMSERIPRVVIDELLAARAAS